MVVKALKCDDDTPNCTEFVYLHGRFEDDNGYDLIYCEQLPAKDGIYDCDVVINDVAAPGKLFFWRVGKTNRGLVVSLDDPEHLKDAKAKFDKRSVWL